MLTLVFPTTTLTSASIPVRWCLDAESLDKMLSTEHKPFIIFQVKYDKRKSTFHLFPLDQFSAYISLKYAGKVSIQAFVITTDNNKRDPIQRTFMCNSIDRETLYPNTKYKNYEEGSSVRCQTFAGSRYHDFDVDSNLFGKEWPNWVMFILNRYWYNNKPQDQCEVRRRMMLWPFTTMIPLLIEFICREVYNIIVLSVFWSALVRLSPSHLLHPFSDPITSYDIGKCSWLLNDLCIKVFKKPTIIKEGLFCLATFPLMPVIILIGSLIAQDNLELTTLPLIIGCGLILGYVGVFSIAVAVAIVIGFWMGVAKVFCYIVDKFPILGRDIRLGISTIFDVFENFIYNLFNTTSKYDDHVKGLLICVEKDGECLPPIKIQDKSIKLIFADIKNKVCKPMQG